MTFIQQGGSIKNKFCVWVKQGEEKEGRRSSKERGERVGEEKKEGKKRKGCLMTERMREEEERNERNKGGGA